MEPIVKFIQIRHVDNNIWIIKTMLNLSLRLNHIHSTEFSQRPRQNKSACGSSWSLPGNHLRQQCLPWTRDQPCWSSECYFTALNSFLALLIKWWRFTNEIHANKIHVSGLDKPMSFRAVCSNDSSSNTASYIIYLAVHCFSCKGKGSSWNRRHPLLNWEILSLFKTKREAYLRWERRQVPRELQRHCQDMQKCRLRSKSST